MKFIKISDSEARCDEMKVTVTITRPDPEQMIFSINIIGLRREELSITYSAAGGDKVVFLPTERELGGVDKNKVYRVAKGALEAFGVSEVRFQNSRDAISPTLRAAGWSR